MRYAADVSDLALSMLHVNEPTRRYPTMQRILIVGAGFAGMYATLSAARLRDEHGVSPDTLEIVVVAPEPRLVTEMLV